MTALDKLQAFIRSRGICCACGNKLRSRLINFVGCDYRATWQSPTSGNVYTGESGRAIAILCDRCIGQAKDPKYVVEWTGEEIVYHQVTGLETMPPEPTYAITHGGRAIMCLVCGRTSWHPVDVEKLYCGCCKRFHERSGS